MLQPMTKLLEGASFPDISGALSTTGFEREVTEIFTQFWPIALLIFGFTIGPRLMKRIVK